MENACEYDKMAEFVKWGRVVEVDRQTQRKIDTL